MAIAIPTLILKQLYTRGSLQNVGSNVQFAIKNRLADATIIGIEALKIDGVLISLDSVKILHEGTQIAASEVSADNQLSFTLRQILDVVIDIEPLAEGSHDIEIGVNAEPFGLLQIDVQDDLTHQEEVVRIPRDESDDYSAEAIAARQEFLRNFTGTNPKYIFDYSIDPQTTSGNVEHFTGTVQIPMGIAGPLQVDGEHAQGEFLIPLATTEGALVASYNRGIKALNLSGGVKTTIIGDAMQRAPVFVFDDARGARDFVQWVKDHTVEIAAMAESTSSVAKLTEIDCYLSNKFAFLRINFTTGDAAGQNMVSKATFAACNWILNNYSKKEAIKHFYLESNLATDKKASQINTMRTRGKRVVAEATIPRDVLIQHLRVTPEALSYHAGIANVGAMISGVNNNGLHAANALTAMFIATGQDVANVAESSTGIIYCELTANRDLYISITLPSMIVATHGGGTRLGTQNECLAMLDCVGLGKVNKFAEIVAGVVLAGELSLASAISASDWVASHEAFGRNKQ